MPKTKTIKQLVLYTLLFLFAGITTLAQSNEAPVRVSAVHGRLALDSISAVREWKDGIAGAWLAPQAETKRRAQYAIYFTLQNDQADAGNLFLRNCDNGVTEMFVLDNLGHTISTQKTGYYISIQNKFGHDEQAFLPVHLNAGQTVNIRMLISGYNGNKPDASVSVYDTEAYYKFYKDTATTANTQEYITTFFTGAIFMMMVFFWFMYIKSRQALYGRYALYLTMQLLYGLLRIGPTTLIGYATLHYPVLKASLISPIILVAVAGYAWFINELLDLKHTRPRLYQQLKWVAICLLCYSFIDWIVFYSFPNLSFQALTFFVVRIVLVLINLYILFSVAVFVKSSIKKYYIIGNSFFLLFGVLAGFKEINAIFSGTYFASLNNANWYMIGILLECIFFAFALGIRIKELQQEKQKADTMLIEQMQVNEKLMREANQQLEAKVAERTAHILEQEKKIETARLLETKAAYEKQLSESRMQALRSRMNPHFLFNSLNSIKYFILKNENDTAAFYLNRFSKLLRQILEYSNHETITLQQELDTLKIYLEIESLRFDQSFHYDIRVDESIVADRVNVPPLILQPFVENAIWHGLANSDKSDKFCNVEVFRQNGHIRISISDNGIGRAAAAIIKEHKINKLNGESFGMKITEERISIFNSGSNGNLKVAVEDNVDEAELASGTTINITLQNKQT
ncbi:MAG: histidine kinase [Chitinophagaceae bacterium]